ncbi:DUF11 domain-containing protein [Cellulosimicrobium sp. MI9406]|uniref:hypothetical protein n=1 Tax=Cellulosimicrobium sp. MI9406 TaxID=2931398 RepID=UPI00339FB965
MPWLPVADDNDDRACGTATAPPSTDVSVMLSPPSGQARPGERVQLDAVVRNGGPAGTTAEVRCTPAATAALAVVAATVLTCVVGDLPPGAAVTYRLTGTATGAPGTDLVVTARVAHDAPDTVPENDVAAAAVRLLLGATPPPDPGPGPGPGLPPSGPGEPPAGAAPGSHPAAPGSSAGPSYALAVTGATTVGLAALAALLLGLGTLLVRGHGRAARGPGGLGPRRTRGGGTA